MRLFVRRLPVMAALVLICGGVATVVAYRLPPTYQTSARLLVEAAQIPEGMVEATVRTDPGEQLQVIEQRLLTRANLIDISNRYDVFENSTEMEPDAIVAQMRESTFIFRSSGRAQATLMTIRFQARTGRIAANVVNDYVTRILETNSDFRRERVEGVLGFFRQEVSRLSDELDKQSAEIAQFRSEHGDALPEDQAFRLSRQTILQERVARLERELAATKNQRRQTRAMFATAAGSTGSGVVAVRLTPEQERLRALKLELDDVLSVFSETNPRVVQLRGRIAQLEKQVLAAEDARVKSLAENFETLEDGAAGAISPETSQQDALMQVTLGEIDTRIASIEQEAATTAKELEAVNAAIMESSSNAIALEALQREYVNTEVRYVQATNNLNQAEMSERVEVSAQGQRIDVIENASVPREPSGPNRLAVSGGGFAVGMGLAAGFFVLLEILNKTLRRPRELESRFGITPIATIPYLESSLRMWLRRSSLIAATIVVLVSVPVGLWWIDTNYIPLQLLVEKGLEKMGLG